MITYRDAPPVPADQLATLFAAVAFSRERDAATLTAMVEGSRWIVSAWDGERLVGFARALSDGVQNAYVSTVCVLPDYQRRGIGRELMRRLLDGRDHVKWVLHTRPNARRLYESLGFADATEMLVRERRERKG
ncbi:MAG: GNAT family N-acetyltransferase [Myxococcota bacterium]